MAALALWVGATPVLALAGLAAPAGPQDQGLAEGALGIGSLVGYASTGITSREMYETQKVAAKYGRLTVAATLGVVLSMSIAGSAAEASGLAAQMSAMEWHTSGPSMDTGKEA